MVGPSLLQRLFTALMLLALLPGMPELLETVEHLVHDGHLPHSQVHEQLALDEDHGDALEHGCTPQSHHCGCCVSTPVLPPDGPLGVAPPILATASQRPIGTSWALIARANAPPTPPPTA